MPKYDAFGREIGEDTLSGLGGESESQAQSAASWSEEQLAAARTPQEPAFSASPVEVPIEPPPRQPAPAPASFSIPGQIPVAGRPKRQRRGVGGLGCLISLIFLGVVIAGPIIAIVAFVGDAADSIDDVRNSLEEADDLATPPPPETPAEPPTGLAGRSMLREANLATALATLREEPGKLGRLVLRPELVDSWIITRRDNRTSLAVTFEGEVQRSPTVDVGIPQDTVAWERIDPAVPARFVKRAAKRFGVKAARIDYVIGERDVFDDEPLGWVAYFKGGVIVRGDAQGRPEERIS